MEKIGLPLCPCGSGKLYEECCYKKKGADGEPLFFKGAFTTSDSGNTWHPIPNVRFAAIIGGKTTDIYREYAEELVSKSKLNERNHEDFINAYGVFYQSYEQLLKALYTPRGKGVSFQTDSIEVRKHWKDFLFHGRILIDFVGLHSRETLSLNQDIGGLNKKKYNLLLTIVENLGTEDKNYQDIKTQLSSIKSDILLFINFRDAEKIRQKTIVEFPVIDYEYGLVKDGKVSVNSESFYMISSIKKFFRSIHKLTLILLSIGD